MQLSALAPSITVARRRNPQFLLFSYSFELTRLQSSAARLSFISSIPPVNPFLPSELSTALSPLHPYSFPGYTAPVTLRTDFVHESSTEFVPLVGCYR